MILNIQKGQDNPILRQKANKVSSITPEIKELVFNMVKTMDANDGIGLAAPQIGKSLQIFVMRPDSSQEVMALINPEIIKTSFKKISFEEGCLSLPNITRKVKRAAKIVIRALNLEGQSVEIQAKELTARVIQHEIDHLNGILIIDK